MSDATEESCNLVVSWLVQWRSSIQSFGSLDLYVSKYWHEIANGFGFKSFAGGLKEYYVMRIPESGKIPAGTAQAFYAQKLPELCRLCSAPQEVLWTSLIFKRLGCEAKTCKDNQNAKPENMSILRVEGLVKKLQNHESADSFRDNRILRPRTRTSLCELHHVQPDTRGRASPKVCDSLTGSSARTRPWSSIQCP